jgi:hypothetical protein
MSTMIIRVLILFVIACSLQAATVFNLSNFQHDSTVSLTDDYGVFYGFEFGDITWSQDWQGNQVALLGINGGGKLTSNPIATQFIHATASVDFSFPSYRVTDIFLWGWANTDGWSASASYWITSPCAAAVTGPSGGGLRNCTTDVGSGTILAALDMHTDIQIDRHDTGSVGGMRVAMTLVHNPEPAGYLQIAGGLLALWWMIRKTKTRR